MTDIPNNLGDDFQRFIQTLRRLWMAAISIKMKLYLPPKTVYLYKTGLGIDTKNAYLGFSCISTVMSHRWNGF